MKRKPKPPPSSPKPPTQGVKVRPPSPGDGGSRGRRSPSGKAPPKPPPNPPPKGAAVRKPPPPAAPPRPPGSGGSTRSKNRGKPKPPPPSTTKSKATSKAKPPPKPPSTAGSTTSRRAKAKPPPPPNPPKSTGGSSSGGSVSTGGGSRSAPSAPPLMRNSSSATLPPSNPKLAHSSTSSVMKKRLSGADIVRDDLRRQLREIQSTNNQLLHRKRYLEKRCATFTEKIARLKAPSESTQKAKMLTESALKRVNELSDKLKAAGIQDVSDDTLTRRCTELEEHKAKLGKLKEDKVFLVKAIIELVGGEASMANLLDEAKRKEMFSSPSGKGGGGGGGKGGAGGKGVEIKHGEYADMYQHGKWNFAHPVDTGTGKRIVIMSPVEKAKREDEAAKYREWAEGKMRSKMPTYMEDEMEWGMLKTGYDAVNFFSNSAVKRKGVNVKKVKYTPRKNLFAAQVATNRTPQQQVMTKAAGLVMLPDKAERIDRQGGIMKETEAFDGGLGGGEDMHGGGRTIDTISPDVRKKLGLFEFEDYKQEMQRARKKDGVDYRSWKRGYESQHDQIVSSLRGQLAQIDVEAGMARDEILHLGAL
ncbi:hypothetical protein TrRE_jg13079 [Triparma retinervis]|uniref:Uncharacterized protein n=1 Tax=Triparma retinervis TaxID=2557542 RepID=A0A9W7AHP7_9STRA|nr:hypothetical protein TrRE_jg13079 [Triparma retinervis]